MQRREEGSKEGEKERRKEGRERDRDKRSTRSEREEMWTTKHEQRSLTEDGI